MPLSFRWVGRDHAEIVGRARAFCYAPKSDEIIPYQQRLAEDGRVLGDDILLAERDGQPVGTATSYDMTMWARGGPVSCQGVAWVGTVKTHRRSARSSISTSSSTATSSAPGKSEPGIATVVMREMLRRAREKGQIVSALMPFRASFYDHFGYGLVERRALWTIPLSILPAGDCDGFTFIISAADEQRRACRQRMVEAGQCDIERTAGSWEHHTSQEGSGLTIADQPGGPNSPINSWVHFEQEKQGGKDIIKVTDFAYDSVHSLKRLLCLFGTLRDQYWGVNMALPIDLPVNLWLRESQVPHRLVNHETAELKQHTRMQVRILDHVRFLQAMRLPAETKGALTVGIAETEGHESRIQIDIDGGRAMAAVSTTPADLECSDRTWASIVTGDLPAATAAGLGLLKVNRLAAISLASAFAAGPAPFCTEYF